MTPQPWRTPIARSLVHTDDRDLLVRADQTHLPIAPHPGAFGVERKHHTHEGVDLYCSRGTPVQAVEAGIVVAILPFTGTWTTPPSPWWMDTEAVLVEGASGVVVYGEIQSAVSVFLGRRVQQGAFIGWVAQVLKVDKGYPMSMLHLELHEPGTRETFDWIDEKPPSLLDPTPLLARSFL